MRLVTSANTTRAIKAAIVMTVAGALSTAAMMPAAAQNYPDRRITFVVPYPAGGATDVAARLLANKLQESWKQTVVVDNKSGGAGVIGNDYVAKAAPDGYTVLIAITQVIQAPALGQKVPYDPFKDFAPVTLAALSTLVHVVPEASPAKSVKDLIDLVKAKSGPPAAYGSFGHATSSHLYGELFRKKAGLDMAHVPYRGAAPLLNDLLGNQVTSAFIDYTTGSPQIEAGKLRPLAVTGEVRRKELPDVPTMIELGYPEFGPEGWVGIFVPAGTPKPIIDKLSAELAKIIQSPEGRAGLTAVRLLPVGNTPEQFAVTLKKEYGMWAAIGTAAGIKID